VSEPTLAIVASPALECQSRRCLRWQGQSDSDPDLCTAECGGDGDCDRSPESPCAKGFECMVPVVVGPFCCQKMCVCRDYLAIPDGGNVALPAACALGDAALAENARALFAALPRPAPYGATRFLERTLHAGGRAGQINARRAQGLLALHRDWCTKNGCGRCPLS
jgi:hypothetical protein